MDENMVKFTEKLNELKALARKKKMCWRSRRSMISLRTWN